MTIDVRGALLRTTAILALTAGSGFAALAATTNGVAVNGGGSTLAGGDYETIYGLLGLTTIANPINSTACPANGTTKKLSIYYGFVGSGKGATGFINNDSTQIGCQGNGLADDFGAADVPVADVYSVPTGNPFGLASNQGAAYFKDLYGYQMIQVPAFGTPVTIPFNLSSKTTNGSVNLTDANLCGIFSGKITDWSKVPGSGIKAPTPIAVSYRQDSSGTSFLLTNHLAAVCTAANTAKNITFVGTTKFATLFPGNTTDASGNTHVPSGTFAVDASAVGSGGVQQAIDGTANSIGYLTPDYTALAKDPADTGFTPPVVAKVNNALPSTTLTANALSSAKVNPVATNPDSFGVTVPKPVQGYPIVGYTYLYFSSQYVNATKVSVIKTWLDGLYNVNNTADEQNSVVAIMNGGFVPVPGASSTAKPKGNSFAYDIVSDYLAASAKVPFKVSSKGR